MFNIDWHGMLKIEYDNGWLSYDKLKLFVGWNELTKISLLILLVRIMTQGWKFINCFLIDGQLSTLTCRRFLECKFN